MADDSQSTDGGRRNSFMKDLSSSAAKKALAPLAATAATAGTAYVMRKGNEVWQERVLPKVREKGGGKAVAREALEKGANRLGGRGAEALSGLARRLGEQSGQQQPAAAQQQPTAAQQQPAAAEESPPEPDGQREEERKKRQQRRAQRQRTLEQSGST
jgi:hypothetical protein